MHSISDISLTAVQCSVCDTAAMRSQVSSRPVGTILGYVREILHPDGLRRTLILVCPVMTLHLLDHKGQRVFRLFVHNFSYNILSENQSNYFINI